MRRFRSRLFFLGVGIGVGVVAQAAVACGGGGKGAATPPRPPPVTAPPADKAGHPSGEVVGWSRELKEDSAEVLPAFALLAREAGCAVASEDADSVVVSCPEGPIAMVKEGLKVTIGCQGITLEACEALFERIATADDPEDPGPAPADAGAPARPRPR